MSNGPTSAQLAARLSLDTSGAIAEMQRAGSITDSEAKRMQRALGFVNQIIKERQQLEQQAGAATQQAVAQQASMANSAKQTAWAMRLVPAQFTDVFTQLAGGANPMLVLIQQGGQLKDLFGGFGEMFRGLATYLTPAKLAFGAVALAVGTLGYELYQQQQREKEFQKAILLTGNYAGITATNLNAMAAARAAAGNMTAGEAKSSITAVAGTGAFGPDNINAASEATIRMQRITGETAESIAKDFASMQDGVAKWAAEHNKSMHFISAAQYEQIKAQEDAGNTAGATAIVLEALNKRLREQGDQVGLLAGLWTSAKSAMEDYAAGFARALNPNGTFDNALTTQVTKLANLRASLAKDEADIASGAGDTTSYRAQANATRQKIADQEALVRKLLETYSVQQQVTRATADYQERQAQGIAGAQFADRFQREASNASKAADEIEKYRAAVQKMRDAGDPKAPSQAEEDRFIALYRKKNRDPGVNEGENFLKSLARQAEGVEKARFEMLRLEGAQKGVAAAAEPFIKRLEEVERRQKAVAQAARNANGEIDEQAKQYALISTQVEAGNELAASYMRQAEEIGLNAQELEKLQALRKIEAAQQRALLGANAETAKQVDEIAKKQRENAMQAIADKKRADDAYKANPANGVRKALKEYVDSAKDAAKSAENLVVGGLQRAEDAFINLAKTGKLQLSDLFGFMAEEYLRQVIRMRAADSIMGNTMAGGGGLDFLGAIGTFFGLPGHANGLSYVPYDGYTTRLHEGEKVLTKAQAMSGEGAGMNVDNSIGTLNVGAGMSRGEVMSIVNGALARQEGRMRRLNWEGRLT